MGLTALARCLADLGEHEEADALMQQNLGRLADMVAEVPFVRKHHTYIQSPLQDRIQIHHPVLPNHLDSRGLEILYASGVEEPRYHRNNHRIIQVR